MKTINIMKTGIELINEERIEQIEKHQVTISKDILNNPNGELMTAARLLLYPYATASEPPNNWDKIIWNRMRNKTVRQRLIIAGALIAAELDRLQS
jgi:hypothetical protein